MKTVSEYLREHVLRNVVYDSGVTHTESIEQLIHTEWSHEFEALMRNRLMLGSFRYGKLSRVCDRNYDRVGSAIARLNLYMETGNLEYLVDAANMCLVEYVHSDHPDKHFHAVDDGIHAERT